MTPLTGANDSTQCNGVLGYTSLLADQEETIKVEISLREPLLRSSVQGRVCTLLRDPIADAPLVEPLSFACLSSEEAMAEKLRAALSRRDVAIRDFFDVDHAVRARRLDVGEPGLVDLVRQKMTVIPNGPIDVSDRRLQAVRLQIEPQLRAVLRAQDFADFDLDRAFGIVSNLADALAHLG